MQLLLAISDNKPTPLLPAWRGNGNGRPGSEHSLESCPAFFPQWNSCQLGDSKRQCANCNA